MILCELDGAWYLSSGITEGGLRCGLRCGPLMPHPDGFRPLPPVGAALYGSTPDIAAIRFYPRVLYRNLGVFPIAWKTDSSEPILVCEMMPDKSEFEQSDYYTRSCNIESALVEMRADGWKPVEPSVYRREIHVDELDKIEGQPPEGAL